MKKVLLVALLLLAVSAMAWAQYSVVWQKTSATGTLPSWFSTAHFERGLALGTFGGQQRVLVASRNGGSFIYILDAATGDSLGKLNTTGVTGGTYAIDDVELSEDGVAFVSNLTVNASTSPLKIYRWTSDTVAPVSMSYTGTVASQRFGDVITVSGDVSKSTAKVFAASGSPAAIVTFSTADSGNTWNTSYLAITGVPGTGVLGSVPAVAPIGDGSTGFWVNGNSVQPLKVDATGAVVDSIPGTIAPRTSSSLRYFEKGAKKYLAMYHFEGAAPAGGYVSIFDITDGGANAKLYATFPVGQFGANGNTNGTGDVNVRDNGNGTFTLAGLGSNNGLGVITTDLRAYAKVTFIANTAAVSDTIRSTSTLTVTGGSAAITNWGSGAPLANVGGDYWKTTVNLYVGDTVRYKYRLNGGWENDLDSPLGGNDRELVVGAQDTVLPLMFVNQTGGRKDQYWRPWGAIADSMRVVYFRVNMMGYTSKAFNAGTDQVGVRGDKKDGTWDVSPEFQWGTTHYLTREGTAGMSSYFYSGAVILPKSKVMDGDTGGYKFIINDDWGRADEDNRFFIVPTTMTDTTLAWVWFNNEAPIRRDNTDSVTANFIVNMTTASSRQSFFLGDTVAVSVGYFGTADSTRYVYLVKQGGTQNYAGQIKMLSKIGEMLDYQYYLVKNNALQVREDYYNFQYAGIVPGEAERRQIMVTGNTLTVMDNVVSVTDARRQPYFANQAKLSRTVAVKWEVNLKPAYYAVKAGKTLVDGQGSLTVTTVDSIAPWGVALTGPTNTLLTKDWPSWGRSLTVDSVTQMWDDGTHGDLVAGDTIYTRTTIYDSTTTKGKTFKFGVGGGDNESGFGLNHLENVDDSGPTYTLHTQFGSINPNFYDAWDYTNERPAQVSGVADGYIPAEYSLSQNFPNPFNPSTKIEFALPVRSQVTLKVFNVLGQVVATLTDGVMEAGAHTVKFDAMKLASGVYLYQMKTGSFTSMKKMLLTK